MALRDTLAELFSTRADLVRVLSNAQIDPKRVPLGSSALNDWDAAILEAERQGKWPALLVAALREYPEHTGLWRAIRERLEETRQESETETEMAPESIRNGREFVTYREHAQSIEDVKDKIDEVERRIMDIVNRNNEERRAENINTRHAWRDEFSPYKLKIEVLSHLADRKLIAQGVIIGLVILGGVGLLFLVTGGRITIGG